MKKVLKLENKKTYLRKTSDIFGEILAIHHIIIKDFILFWSNLFFIFAHLYFINHLFRERLYLKV